MAAPPAAALVPAPEPPLRIGISSCLVGEPVRWDGDHRRSAFVTDRLAPLVVLHPVCPEVGIGLGVPREPIRLVAREGSVRAQGVNDPQQDVTAALRAYGRTMVRELPELHGYLFKRDSPSCGLARVEVHRERGGRPARRGVGIYAGEIVACEPLLPVVEEGHLDDPILREHFIERVFACYRWKRLLAEGLTLPRLVAFHEHHKLALMAHGAEPLRRLGRFVAGAAGLPPAKLAARYGPAFTALLARPATPRGHGNVLFHLMSYLKRHLDAADKAELTELIHAFRRGLVPRAAPMALLTHHFRRHPHPYVAGQVYLNPHPAELLLRSAP